MAYSKLSLDEMRRVTEVQRTFEELFKTHGWSVMESEIKKEKEKAILCLTSGMISDIIKESVEYKDAISALTGIAWLEHFITLRRKESKVAAYMLKEKMDD